MPLDGCESGKGHIDLSFFGSGRKWLASDRDHRRGKGMKSQREVSKFTKRHEKKEHQQKKRENGNIY